MAAAMIAAPLATGFAVVAAAALLLPACAVGGLGACPPVPEVASAGRIDDLRARRAALEAEAAALARRLAALPACVPPVTAAVPPAQDIPPDRWARRDIGLLEGCWSLDSDYAMQDRTGRVVRVESWQMCFGADGRGRQTQVFTDGTRCEGGIDGRFTEAGALQLADRGNVPCSGGHHIIARVGTCTLTPEGRATCENRHPSMPDQPPHTVTLRR